MDWNDEKFEEIRAEISEKYAQKPSFTDRRIDFDEEISNFLVRNEFSRDRDRIIFSKAFRRLEHKAQVYSHEKGDHYRTRLTHTIEVMQIARSIAKNLGLNEELTEAIALGHDIGHTPFGHQGENVLDDIMRGHDDLGGVLEYQINYGGFKHNFNGLRVVDILEKKYNNEKGLNLTWQVLDGILKHTKTKKNGKEWDISRFIQCKSQIEWFINYNNPSTLEGQIVALADEIAQRQHDLDDGLRDTDLKLDADKIIVHIEETIKDTIINKIGKELSNFMDLDEKYYPKFKSFVKDWTPADILNDYKEIESISELIPEREPVDYDLWDKILLTRFIVEYVVSDNIEVKLLRELKNKIQRRKKQLTDQEEFYFKKVEKEYLWNSLIRDIIDYFIKDVTINSLRNLVDDSKMRNTCIEQLFNRKRCRCDKPVSIDSEFWNKRIFFDDQIISFTTSANEFDKKIENYIQNQILNSYNVNRFDGKAIYIVRQLFKAYYKNPRQMPKETLDKLSQRLKENSIKYEHNMILMKEPISEIKFRTSPPNDIDELIKLLKLELDKKTLENIFQINYPEENPLKLDKEFLRSINGYLDPIIEDEVLRDRTDNEVIKIFEKINKLSKKDIIKEDKEKRLKIMFIKLLLEHHYVYLSLICDHIAGMTDNYAEKEYKELYLV